VASLDSANSRSTEFVMHLNLTFPRTFPRRGTVSRAIAPVTGM
jgi:hypothetical protein